MIIRQAHVKDVSQIVEIYFNTIHRINLGDYTKEQVNAWAPAIPNPDNWIKRKLQTSKTFVAVIDGKIVGFGELENTGHIDCFYCHHDYLRKGIGSAIYKEIEKYAISHGLKRLFTEASITARPFFQAKGFSILSEQKITCNGVQMTNFKMEKKLANNALIRTRNKAGLILAKLGGRTA